MVTFNGRITLPTDIRKQLGLKTGDAVDFVEIEKGRYAICPRTAAIREMERSAKGPAFVPAMDEIKEAVS
jgi:AbrB family looped-hinge helix DNA binding protein